MKIRLAEKEHVRCEILKSNGNTNSIWKNLNRYIPRKNTTIATVENALLLANKFSEFYANVRDVLRMANINEMFSEWQMRFWFFSKTS